MAGGEPDAGLPDSGLSAVPLAQTARWIAAVRARESRRPDRLFDDPWAAGLAGTAGEEWLRAREDAPALAIMVVRARFFDDFLARAVAADGVRQVVLVAAGLDTRGYRLSWPAGLRLFELDQPGVLAQKQEFLDGAGAVPGCARRPVGVDLAGQWTPALLDAGFDPESPSCWLLEGFLFYLPPAGIARLLDEVTGLAAAGSRLGFDIVNTATFTHPLTRPWIDMQARLGAPWRGALDDPAGFLAGRGWEATLTQPGEPSANFGRWPFPILPRELPGMPRDWLVTARRG
ncbi:MAG TPA: SAM-dependent methyltransferase [Streptosporangiaceae bacterium]|nr:SAM-dependent methyltransferase [Streptosporangiaceae bacterium]